MTVFVVFRGYGGEVVAVCSNKEQALRICAAEPDSFATAYELDRDYSGVEEERFSYTPDCPDGTLKCPGEDEWMEDCKVSRQNARGAN